MMSDEMTNDRWRGMTGSVQTIGEAWKVLRAYGFDGGLPWAEVRARVGVLDRMGAFAPSERATLRDANLL